MDQRIEEEKEVPNVLQKISCYKCSHFPVCIYFRGVQQIVEVPEDTKKFQPFAPEHIAKLCKFYSPDPFL